MSFCYKFVTICTDFSLALKFSCITLYTDNAADNSI